MIYLKCIVQNDLFKVYSPKVQALLFMLGTYSLFYSLVVQKFLASLRIFCNLKHLCTFHPELLLYL